jgi:enoyl-CoA hydratase
MENLKIMVGDTASQTKTFSQEEVTSYAKSSMDNNPVHYDLAYASKTYFKKPIVQGLFVSSLFGGLLGSKLPGRGTIHLGQTLKFVKPVFVGETVTAKIEVTNVRDDKPVITFKCVIFKEDSTVAIEGESVVMYKGEVFI